MQPTGYRIDLVVFAERRWIRELSSICEVVDLDKVAGGDGHEGDGDEDGGGAGGSYPQFRRHGNESTCFVVPYPRPPEAVWQVGGGGGADALGACACARRCPCKGGWCGAVRAQ